MYMVQAMIRISDNANRILNVVKAKHEFKDKSEAIEYVVMVFGEEILEKALKPDFIRKMNKRTSGKSIGFQSVEQLRKRYGVRNSP